MKKLLPVLLILCVVALSGSGVLAGYAAAAGPEEDEKATIEVFAMDTYMTLTAYGSSAEDALKQAEEELLMLDALLSTGSGDSEISELNKNGHARLSEVSAYLLQRSMEVNEMSGGTFNPLVYPLMEAWGFTTKKYLVPEEETIRDLLPLTDLSGISYNEETRELTFLKEGMALDFGGIAKGYASSRVMEILRQNGVESAVVSLGGNVQLLGAKPNGNLWKVAVRDPDNEDSFLGILQAADTAVITSGGYERFFEQDGHIYHHILDPATGYPAENGLVSVTIVSSDGTLADGLSTALFVAGLEGAAQIWRNNSSLFDAIFLTDDRQIYVTEGIADAFTSSSCPVTILTGGQ